MKAEEFRLKYTHTDHIAQEKLGLSLNEYAICNTVYQLSTNPKSRKPGWCTASREYLARHISITDRGVRKIVVRLLKKKLLEKDGRSLRTTERWFRTVVVRQEKRNKVPGKAEQSSGQSGTKFRFDEKANNEENNGVSENKAEQSSTYNIDNIYNKRSYNGKKSFSIKDNIKKHDNKASSLSDEVEKLVEEIK